MNEVLILGPGASERLLPSTMICLAKRTSHRRFLAVDGWSLLWRRVFGQACAADQRANKLVEDRSDKLHVNFRAVYTNTRPGGGQQGLTKPPGTAAAVLLSKCG